MHVLVPKRNGGNSSYQLVNPKISSKFSYVVAEILNLRLKKSTKSTCTSTEHQYLHETGKKRFFEVPGTNTVVLCSTFCGPGKKVTKYLIITPENNPKYLIYTVCTIKSVTSHQVRYINSVYCSHRSKKYCTVLPAEVLSRKKERKKKKERC